MKADPNGEKPHISVSAEGTLRVEPDLAVVRLGATFQEAEASAAQANVNRVMTDALAAVRDLGIPEEEIHTAGISLQPVYKRPGREGGEPTITSYRASNTLSIRVTDLAKVGDVIDAAVNAGANEMRDISFALEDSSAAELDALRIATKAAQAKAKAMAEAAGVELGGLLRLAESGAGIAPRQDNFTRMAMAAEAAPGAPVQAGQIEIRAQVTAEYRISRSGKP